MLPTDERYLSLSQAQITVLFNFWLNTVPEDMMKYDYWKNKKAEAPEIEQLRELGYTDAQIETIRKEFTNV